MNRKPPHHLDPTLLTQLRIPTFDVGEDGITPPDPPSGGAGTIAIELDPLLAAYVLYCIAGDLKKWQPNRRCELDRDAAIGFAMYLHDVLPERHRTPVPPPPADGAVRLAA